MNEQRDVQLAQALVGLADSLRKDFGVIDTMDLLVAATTQFSSAIEAGVVLADATNVLHVVASTGERAATVEEAQLGRDQGPCFDCYASGEVVDVPDIMETAERWPDFAAAAIRRGFVAAHAVPLRTSTMVLGSVNLFSDEPGGLSAEDVAIVRAMADVATISILQRDAVVRHIDTATNLQRALDSRVLIEQAKGVLAQRHGIEVDEAFRRLRSHARERGTRIHDVARDVVEQRLPI